MLFALGASYAVMAQRGEAPLSWAPQDIAKVGALSIGLVVTTWLAVRLLAVWS
jgi:hypothetical protein